MNKEKNMKLNLNPYFESTIETSSVVWSHDENSYQFNFDFTEYLCDKPFDLTDGKPRILLEFLNDKNAEVQIYPLIIDSEKLGVAHFIIPERVLGYVGDVKASLTIDFSNKSYDLGNFMFKMKKSPIDNKMPQLQFYVDEFEKAIEKAERLDLVTKPELEQELQKVQSGFLGEFNSVAELKSKYPNGTNGYAVVFENSVGYTYTYKNNVWTKGNVWNGMAIAKKSITSNEIADLEVKRTNIGNKAIDNTKIADLTITDKQIANESITLLKLDGSVTGLNNHRLELKYDGYKLISVTEKNDSTVVGRSTINYDDDTINSVVEKINGKEVKTSFFRLSDGRLNYTENEVL